MESDFKNAEKKALRLIARAEQCSAGLLRKLEKRGVKNAIAAEVISRLTETGLLDDARFSRLWLQSRLRLTRTPRRLLAGLCARGIPHNEAETALANILDEEVEIAMLERFIKKYAKKADKYALKYEGFSKQAIEQITY